MFFIALEKKFTNVLQIVIFSKLYKKEMYDSDQN